MTTKHTMTGWAVLFAMIAMLTTVTSLHGDEGWTDNFEKAQAQAAEEGKDLFLDFTGSDWCGWCIRLHDEVFSKEPFKSGAPEKFVLVTLDFPQSKQLAPQTVAQNETLQRAWGVTGFPTIVLADAQGRPYAVTGYQQGGSESYMNHLDQLMQVRVQRDELFKKADEAEGVEKARLLDQGIAALSMTADMRPTVIMASYQEQVDQIIAADADNEAELKSKYQLMGVVPQIMALAQQGDMDAVIKKADELMEQYKPTGQLAQDLLYFKSFATFQRGDRDAALQLLEEALAAKEDGEKAQTIRQALISLRQQ